MRARGMADNNSYQNVVAWTWTHGGERAVIVVNLSDALSQAHVRVPGVEGGMWSLSDPVNGVEYTRAGSEMNSPGLYVELGPWGFHFFECRSKAGAPEQIG